MHILAFRIALRDWRKILLIGLVLAVSSSLLIYYQTMMWEMSAFVPGSSNQTLEVNPVRPIKVPQTRTELLISLMTLLVLVVALLFQMSILVVDMIRKQKQYQALRIIGASETDMELFPLMYSILISILASIIIAIFWHGMLPYISNLLVMSSVNTGLVLIVIIFQLIASIIIGLKAMHVAEVLSN
ncbi:MAG: hypothetical protein MJB12_06375 [Firmicutes bacterium]|nr:hypothetical protein [Bacillota bacterium]